jgi:hypothetical protein
VSEIGLVQIEFKLYPAPRLIIEFAAAIEIVEGGLRLAGASRIPTKVTFHGPPCQNDTQLCVSHQETYVFGLDTGLASIPGASGSVGSGRHRRRFSGRIRLSKSA